MGGCWSAVEPFIQPVVCYMCNRVDYMCKLQENLRLLETALDTLKGERKEVVYRVRVGNLKGEQQREEVTTWLSQVEDTVIYTEELINHLSSQDASGLDSQDQLLSASGCCSMDNMINSLLGEDVFKTMIEVQSLAVKGKEFPEVTRQPPPPVAVEKSSDPTFGLDGMVRKTWDSLLNDKNRILGIHGMGGIGKTTLLALINDKFINLMHPPFDIVIWVKVSQVVDINGIQDDIGKRLGIDDEKWKEKSKSEKTGHIFQVLNSTRFLLLLDDLWEKLSLQDIGIPLLATGKNRKVLFTTRYSDVCRRMEANVHIEVESLDFKDGWDLFKHKAGAKLLDENMLDVAEEIARKCGGFPLALRVIGASMSSTAMNADGWRRALETWNISPSKVEDVEKELFPVVRVSYDRLEDVVAKVCCHYCALFPEAYNVKEDELVEYWIGEGIIDTKSRGYKIIETLVGASLLSRDGKSVHMHDMIREMALWIVSTSVGGEEFVVRAGTGLIKLPKGTDWKSVTKMSLMNNVIKSIHDDPDFPTPALLITLFLQNNELGEIVGSFFVAMSTLVVLDLSWNRDITNLPEEISALVSLRYLKLLRTRIRVLPQSFKKLVNLIHLDLESTSNLESVSISGLLKLRVLRFYGSAAALEISLLENLERLEGLELLTITVRKDDVLEAFLGSELAGYTQGIYLEGVKVSVPSFGGTFGAFGSLRNLKMINCDIKESETDCKGMTIDQYSPSTSSNPITPSNRWFKNLSDVVIDSCIDLKDVTWLAYATQLEYLSIALSPKMKEVISKQKVGNVEVEPFQKLQVLKLDFMDELESIYWRPLSSPRLQKVHITKCKNLPLNSITIKNIDDLLSRRN